MSYRPKRKLEDFDPNKSDSDDGDYDHRAPSSSVRPRTKGKASQRHKNSPRKPKKRARRSYADSDDDIEADDDDLSEEESFAEDSEEQEEEPAVNPSTGRRQRKAARKPVQYQEESEEEEIQATDDASPEPQARGSLIVRLRIDHDRLANVIGQDSDEMPRPPPRARSTRAASTRGSTPNLPGAGPRRSSRISQTSEEPQPLIQLTDSGKHTRPVRTGSSEPPQQTRQTRGGKGPKKLPSAIMEASHEDSGLSHAEGPEGFISQLQEHATEGDIKDELGEGYSPMASETQLETDVIPQSEVEADAQEEGEEDDDDDVVRKPSRSLRSRAKPESPHAGARRSLRPRKSAMEQSSDFEPEGEEAADEDMGSDDELQASPRRGKKDEDSSSGGGGRRSGRLATKRGRGSQRQSERSEDGASELDIEEIADEAADLEDDRRRNKRPRRTRRADPIAFEPNLRNRSNRPDYRVYRPELLTAMDEDDGAAPTASQPRNRRAAAPYRSLFSTLGPFGGAGGPAPVFGGPGGTGAAGGAESDSSDDDMQQRAPRGVRGSIAMTPIAGGPVGVFPQTMNADPAQSTSGAPANFGKVKDRKALADADPLGVDTTVNFEGVGGLDNHIDRLREMVALPLLYPEIFMQMHVTPPRGVLFHGPPGTGKTLLARALASSVSSHGKKVTFYMRKGADALSKWVGEAERQLRLLFDEARKNQPSIIFFDEIDGLAPVRSSKQEQIHASIVATLLALMDGMDGRGQVIVIGATNRPDSVDPALRRPGRFDREFYFPLPSQAARRSIIDIHTKGWEPPLKLEFKDQLADITKGYGGADLRALCTEAALNAVQGTYPQIYSSNKKLLIDPTKIKVLAKDFMISVKKIVPSSERSASSGSAPLKKSVEPLLRKPLADVSKHLNEIVPPKKHATALEEAMYDDRDDEMGFERENMHREFESARIFRPRLLIKGSQGMGQQYIGAALLNKFEGLYVSSFDLPNLYKDSTRSAEAAVVQMFEEVKRHKPSVIYIPNVNIWYATLTDSVIRTFTGLLRALPPADPVLVLGVMESLTPEDKPDPSMMRDLFGYSQKNTYELQRPDQLAREEYFACILEYIGRAPPEFPDPTNRKKRHIEELPEAPAQTEQPKGPSKEELKTQKKHDRHTLNTLKLHIQQVMDQIKLKYKKFRAPPIDDKAIGYLYDEQDPEMLTTDLGEEQMQQQQIFRPYKKATDDKGLPGLREVETDKFYYNLEIVTIEKRLSNGYYKRPKDFLADIRKLAKDARTFGEAERLLKANEMLANVEVDMTNLELSFPALTAECEAVYQRELQREAERLKSLNEGRQQTGLGIAAHANVPPDASNTTSEQTTGPVHLGEDVPAPRPLPPYTPGRGAWDQQNMSKGDSLSNGNHHPQSNGSGAPSGPTEDIDMHDSLDVSGMVTAQEREGFEATGTPGQNTQTQKSQRSSVMQMAAGSQAYEYRNSASTTTSGQKTSDRSNRDSGHSGNTHRSNGAVGNGDGPDFGVLGPAGGSQLPDTQEEIQHVMPEASPHSSPQSLVSSQPMGPPPKAPVPKLIPASAHAIEELTRSLVEKSSGFTVEQLEQVMSALMNAIWDTRGEWNRGKAMMAVSEAFNDTTKDIVHMQAVLKPSQYE